MANNLLTQMLKQFGPLMGGDELHKALGFSNSAAFGQALRQGRVSISVFEIAGRRGKFALTEDVANWVLSLPLQEGKSAHLKGKGARK
jgi:hypothetical protein